MFYLFDFFRYGPGIGTLSVYLQSEGSQPIVMWTLSGEQPDDWFQGKVGFTVHTDHSLLIEAKITSNDEGDIAIDDIAITNGYCPIFPAFAKPSEGLTTTTAITTEMLVKKIEFF
jgi:hypothetical protein